jgi:4-amino-4-deoxy-L-arabinose transferase-like glycosyltransferase
MESHSVATTTSPRRGGTGLVAILDYAVTSHARAVSMLIVVALLAFLPGFFQIAPVDRDEARFAQATKQMVESGDYVDIRFQDEVRYKKPVGIYWLQATAVKTAETLGLRNATTTIWLYRLPSLIGAIGAVLLTYWTALAFVSRRGAAIAALMMASSIMLGIEARLAKTDAVLLLTALAAMGAMARAYLAERRAFGLMPGWGLPFIFWTAMAAGILIKGPLIVMFVGLPAIALGILDRSLRWVKALRPLPGIVWMIALVLPWFAAIVLKAGDSFFEESLGHDMLAKVASSQEAHGAPPGYYFALFWVTFWPAATLAGLALPMIWKAKREPGAQFLLAWIIPSWIVFEAVVTKLPHYVLPLYPAIAILIAGVITPDNLAKKPWMVRGTMWWFIFPVIIGGGAVAGFVLIDHQLGFVAWPFAAAAIISGLFAWWLYDVDGPERSLLRACLASVLVSATIYGLTFPALPALFPSAQIAEALRDPGCKQPAYVAAGYQEPSLVFLVGTQIQFTDGAAAAEWLGKGPCRFALLDRPSERSFVQRAQAIGLRYAPGPRVEGYNISIGKPVTLAVYRSEDTP